MDTMKDIDKFLKFSESLKLVRKANIEDDDGKSIIDEVYTDLLPKDGILKKINLPKTTIVYGRKGTGKSTIFQRSKRMIEEKKENLAIYIDVYSLFSNSTPDIPELMNSTIYKEEVKKYLLYSNLLNSIIKETINKLEAELDKSLKLKIRELFTDEVRELKKKLQHISNSLDDVFRTYDLSLLKTSKVEKTDNIKSLKEFNLELNPSQIGIKLKDKDESNSSTKKVFDENLLRYLNIKESLIDKLSSIKKILDIKHLYIYLDDFSEIEYDAQCLFIDWFVTPLNNQSEDFIKFKIAAYPGRFYHGKLDPGKIDTVNLDFFDAFYAYEIKRNNVDISTMENLAIDYTKRLLENRIKVYFPDDHWFDFFEDLNENQLYQLLFEVSLNIPRKIGYILSYCHESCLIHDCKISREQIENAAVRYFREVTEKYFVSNPHIIRPFDDQISIELQNELIKKIIERQSNLQNEKRNLSIKRKLLTSSHFTVSKHLTETLNNLELNGYINTYNKIKIKNEPTTVYSIDYGLSKSWSLIYKRPGNTSEIHNTFYNLNALIIDFFNTNHIIKCPNSHEFQYSQLDDMKKYGMKCPICLENNEISECKIFAVNKELIEKITKNSKNNTKIQYRHYLVLSTIYLSKKAQSISYLSNSLDLSEEHLIKLIDELIDLKYLIDDVQLTKELGRHYYNTSKSGAQLIELVEKAIRNDSL